MVVFSLVPAGLIRGRPGAHPADSVVGESLGAGVLPAHDPAGLLEAGAGDELPAVERMRKVALRPALDDAPSMDNDFGFTIALGGSNASAAPSLGHLIHLSLTHWKSLVQELATRGGGQNGGLAGRTTVHLDVLVGPTTTLLATRQRRSRVSCQSG